MTKKPKHKRELEFTTTHELAEYLIKIAEYIKSLPNIQLVPKKTQIKARIKGKEAELKIIKEKFEKEVKGKSLESIKEILSRKKRKELEIIAKCYNISNYKNIRKNELIDIIINNLRFSERFEKLRRC